MSRSKDSKRWSKKDIMIIKNFIKEAKDAGKSVHSGMQAAADHFGLTRNAIYCRWKRYIRGEHLTQLKKNTTKVPVIKRKYTRKSTTIPAVQASQSSGRSMTFKITNVQVDLNKGEITVSY
jgi:hypothetical protein